MKDNEIKEEVNPTSLDDETQVDDELPTDSTDEGLGDINDLDDESQSSGDTDGTPVGGTGINGPIKDLPDKPTNDGE